jgi:membrane protease YdiL (CAAX protease family)
MLKILKKYNFNYLILTGAVIFCCTMLIYIYITFIFEEEINNLSRFNSINNYFTFIFSALIIAPIFEEYVFRGYFTNNSVFKIISFVGSGFYIFLTNNHHLYILLVILLILNFINKINKIYFFIISSILFSLVHYNLDDFKSIITIVPMFFQFSLGLILIWVVLNFNLKSAIISHFLFNLFFIIIFTIPLQFPKSKNNKVEYLGYRVEWNKVPLFTNENTLISRPNDYEVIAENVDVITFYKAFNSISNHIIVSNDNKFNKFKLKITRIDSTANKLDNNILEKLLKKANLIDKQ